MGYVVPPVKITLSTGEKIALTYKQYVFCRFYIMFWNGTKAGELAGYAHPAEASSANLNNLKIKTYIEDTIAQLTAPVEEITARLTEIARLDIGDIIRILPDGGWEIDMELAKQIGFTRHIKKLNYQSKTDKDGNVYVSAQIELKDGMAADDKLLRVLGKYNDRIVVDWRDTLPDGYNDRDVIDAYVTVAKETKGELTDGK